MGFRCTRCNEYCDGPAEVASHNCTKGDGCSHRNIIVRKAMYCGPRSHFASQRGCLDCGEWLDPVRIVDRPLEEDEEAAD